jgi:polyisoprenoid-binding protein YceI
MKKLFLLLFIITIACAGFAGTKPVTKWSITFQAKNMGITVDGTITGLQADVQFNPANLDASTIQASVDANTVNTDNSSRDEHLKGDGFFDVAHYPKITIKSVSFKHKSGNNYTGKFNLTIKNKTKTVDIPFTCIEKDNLTTFKGTFKINRLDFGIGDSSLILSDEVTINIIAEVAK